MTIFTIIGTDHLNLDTIVVVTLKMVLLFLQMKRRKRFVQITVKYGVISMNL